MGWILDFWCFTDLKVAAFANLTESGDAVQKVGGNCLVLLFKEPKGGEREACMVAVAILMHDRHLVPRTPEKKITLAVRVIVDRFCWKGLMTYETNRLKKVLLVGYGEIEA